MKNLKCLLGIHKYLYVWNRKRLNYDGKCIRCNKIQLRNMKT